MFKDKPSFLCHQHEPLADDVRYYDEPMRAQKIGKEEKKVIFSSCSRKHTKAAKFETQCDIPTRSVSRAHVNMEGRRAVSNPALRLHISSRCICDDSVCWYAHFEFFCSVGCLISPICRSRLCHFRRLFMTPTQFVSVQFKAQAQSPIQQIGFT